MNNMSSYKATPSQSKISDGRGGGGEGTTTLAFPDRESFRIPFYRSHQDEKSIDNNSFKPVPVNLREGADTRSRPTFQRPQNGISKTSLPTSNRLRKAINGLSDPRFKRIIPIGGQNDACVGTEMKPSKPAEADEDKKYITAGLDENNKYWSLVDSKSNNLWKDSSKNIMSNKCSETAGDCTNIQPREGPQARDTIQEDLKEVDKFNFNHVDVSSAVPKQSISDCTVNTRNTSLVSEDLGDDYLDRLHSFSSTTRVKKVQNWIAEQKPKLDKRQSVITVIGQTQGQSALSSALHEIDQRRKLVKELDKYAICNKIIDSDKVKEMNTLVAQINFLSPTGKFLRSGDRAFEIKDLPRKSKPSDPKNAESGGGKQTKRPPNNYKDFTDNDHEANTEQDTSLCPSSESSSNHNQKKKFYKWNEGYDIKGKVSRAVSKVHYPFLAYFTIIVSATLCWYTYFIFQKSGYLIFELFPQKPKTTTWYEKVCYWVWELFRPSANYHRSSS